MTNATAKKYGLKTIADLKKVGAFKLGGFPECQTRNTCFVGYTKQYGLTNASFCLSSGASRPTRRSTRARCSPADVFSTDPPLGKRLEVHGAARTRSTSPGFQNVAPIVKTSVATAAGSTFTSTVNAVSAKLTLPRSSR